MDTSRGDGVKASQHRGTPRAHLAGVQHVVDVFHEALLGDLRVAKQEHERPIPGAGLDEHRLQVLAPARERHRRETVAAPSRDAEILM